MQVKVKSLTGQVTEVSDLPDDASVALLKARIQQLLGIPPNVQRIIHAGHELAQDELRLDADCGVTDGTVVHLAVRMSQAVPPVVPAEVGEVDEASSSQGQQHHSNQHHFSISRGAVFIPVEDLPANPEDRFLHDVSSLRFLTRTLSLFVMLAFLQLAVYVLVSFWFIPLYVVPVLAWMGLRRLKYEYLIPYAMQQVVVIGITVYIMIRDKKTKNQLNMSVFTLFLSAVFVLWLCGRFINQLRRMTLDERRTALAWM
eukprot:TRINITY_DN10392_c0_g3_i1.p1 TRINITY_DN10392_c0_g3~~TRINITY_DN10392_c0_g3_i1.p1  ORF type:complete len:257 (-),score=56.11 TRINITY_DN10392_c0_g3_i1:152-922(-)